ncbi:hypothetical protein AcW1_003655 [Taiwanofungus camphoratus]|nr:hypothetical protein AcV5_007344 [Antrodia cinnamomea]KAI0940467.1 hypothetical protein AcW1_003655 [Antrodia cinnamomea]KAI0958363.1 hypothetical protein AcV7_004200 [Antrodia cinnamomea]
MTTTMLRSQAARTFVSSARASPLVARGAYTYVRTYASTPDPMHPTDTPSPSDVPKPSGSNNTLLWLVGGTGLALGGWYYMRERKQEDATARRKADQEKARAKAGELGDATKRTAQDAVKEGEQGYSNIKASGEEKLAQARSQATGFADGTRAAVAQNYDAAKAKVEGALHETETNAKAAYDKASAETQSWGAWLGSWFGYGRSKADEAKREGAGAVAEGAAKVEKEAGKRS